MQATDESIAVLHVDDEPDFADVTAAFLEREDDRFTVETATSAGEGFERLAAIDCDCVVSDYDMPGRNGIEFLETVREEYPDLPFLLFTGKGSEEVASDAISAGATDYLQKEGGTEQYELLANRIRNAVEQYRTTQRAAELDRVRTLTSDINQALVRAESRADIEARVCEIISDSDPYLFAWIGDVDLDGERIEPRTSAGIEDGYLDEITVTTDDTPTGRGPSGTAIRERRVAVSQNVLEDPEFEPWREAALERGYRAVAAVPLEHGDALYGELVVYAERADAFDEDERELLAELGDDIAHACHSFDVQDRIRAERDQRRALFANAPVPVIAGEVHGHGAQHRITGVNDTFEDVFGYDSGEVVGKDIAEVIVPDGWTERHEEFRERTTAGEATVTEVERITADGPREFLLTIVPHGTDVGPADGWYAWYTDISERRERERAIEALHSTADMLLEAETTEAIAEIAVDAARHVLDMPANSVHLYDERDGCLHPVAWTDRAEELIGEIPALDSGESLAWRVFETGEARVYDDVAAAPGRLSSDTAVRSEIILPLDNHGVFLVSSSDPRAFDETDVSLAQTLAAHVTTALDHVEREDEFTRRQELLEAILETSIDGILVVDENREYVTWNRQFIDMWGVPEELIGDESEETGLEWVFDRLENPDEFIDGVEYLYEHPHEESRDQVRLADGRVFDRYSAPVEADDGTYFGRVWFFRNITEWEGRERKLEHETERLTRFANTLSHDLRNPLNVAEGRLELAREERDSEHLDAAADALDRSLSLIDDLLALAREGAHASDVEAVDLAATVDGCWRNVETTDARLVVETDRTVRAVPSQLKRLLENLMRNAVEYGGDDVTVTVGDLDDGFYVADDGPGIPETERSRVFEAGYSTADEGTGFGLNIVREITETHGWTVRVTDGEAGGARFEITGVVGER